MKNKVKKAKARAPLGLFHLFIRNIRHRAFRNAITVTCIAVLSGALIFTTLVVNGVDRSLEVGFARLGADLLVVPEGTEVSIQEAILTGVPTKFYMDRSIESRVAAVSGVDKTASQLFIVSLSGASCCATGNYQLIAIDSEADFTISPWVETHLEEPLGKDELIVGADTIFGPGAYLQFYGHDFTIKAKLEMTGLGLDSMGFMTLESAYEMIEESETKAVIPLNITRNQISAVLCKIAPEKGTFQIAIEIERTIPEVDVIRVTKLVGLVKDQVSPLATGVLLFGGIMWVMSTLLLSTIFLMVVNERRREIGLLRAIGATRWFVFKIVMSEAILLTVIGGILGIIGGGTILYSYNALIKESLNIPYLWPSIIDVGILVGNCLALSIAVGVVASFYPAIVSSKMEPYEAIRSGER